MIFWYVGFTHRPAERFSGATSQDKLEKQLHRLIAPAGALRHHTLRNPILRLSLRAYGDHPDFEDFGSLGPTERKHDFVAAMWSG